MLKHELAIELSEYPYKEMRRILRAARHLQRFTALAAEEETEEEEREKIIQELEEE